MHEAAVQLFKEIAAGKYEAFTSDYVVEELKKAPAVKRDKMMLLITDYDIIVLDKSKEAEMLADIYVNQTIIPAKYHTDGLHIAVAALNYVDTIVSLNFQHIVKPKTRLGTALINLNYGCKPIQILSPMEVIEDEEI